MQLMPYLYIPFPNTFTVRKCRKATIWFRKKMTNAPIDVHVWCKCLLSVDRNRQSINQGYTSVKIEWTESREPAVLAKWT